VYNKAEMYSEILMQRFKEHIKANLLKAKTDQKASSEKFSGLENET
jgi:hypothetical protein